MTSHEIEQVSPSIHPTCAKQATKTWHQPRIRLHSSVLSTPSTVKELLPSYHFRTTKVRIADPSSNDSRQISPLLNSTPVTHPTIPKSLRFRISNTQPDYNAICRQLFPTVTPAKRPRDATPSFRFSCGRERTQPFLDQTRNVLVNELDAHIGEAQKNLHIFKNGLSTKHPDNAFQAVINEGLLFNISCRDGNVFILVPFAHHPNQQNRVKILLAVPFEMLSEPSKSENYVDYSGRSVYIPYPWHTQVVDGLDSYSSCILIGAHKVEIFRKEQLASLANLTIITTHDRLPLLNISAKEAGIPTPTSIFRFAALSPHLVGTHLSIFVEFYDPDNQLAIIRDDAGNLALLVTGSTSLQANSRKHFLSDVSILPHRVQSSILLEGLRDRVDERLYERLLASGSESYLAFEYGDNLQRRSP